MHVRSIYIHLILPTLITHATYMCACALFFTARDANMSNAFTVYFVLRYLLGHLSMPVCVCVCE